MGKISEAIMRATILGGRLLKRLKTEVGNGEVAQFDVFLKKETEYMVKGKVLKGRASATLSLVDEAGSAVRIYSGAKGKYFSVIPERDGLYRIRADVTGGLAGREPVTVLVTLYSHTFPGYAMLHITAASYQSAILASTDDRTVKRLPQTAAAARRQLDGASTMACCGLSENDREKGGCRKL